MLTLILDGQCPSGKNAITITRTGLRFPSKRFAAWRAEVLQQINKQLSGLDKKSLPLDYPVSVDIHYFPSDKRRRDVPGIIDALWHVLEKAEIVTDDRYLGGAEREVHFFQYSKSQNPRAEIKIHE